MSNENNALERPLPVQGRPSVCPFVQVVAAAGAAAAAAAVGVVAIVTAPKHQDAQTVRKYYKNAFS